MNQFTIRKAKLDELKRIVRITKQAYKVPFKKGGVVTGTTEKADLVSQYKNNKFKILVFELNGKIIGSIRYYFPEKDKLYFYKLAVLKSFRNKGIGYKLISEVEKIAKRKKIKIVTLDCMREKGLPDYYKKLGYKISKIVFKKSKLKKHGDYHEVHMYKMIK